MTSNLTPFVRFTYTILDPDGRPCQKSLVVNLSYIISIEARPSNDLKIFLTNNQVISIELGDLLDANEILEEILSTSAAGSEFCVYKIDTFEKK